MKPFAIVTLALMASHGALAQESHRLTFSELLKGEVLKHSLKVEELPDDFRALDITTAGMGNYMDMVGGMMGGMMGGLLGGGNAFADAVSKHWTNGREVSIGEQTYLVTYKGKVAFDLNQAGGGNEAPKMTAPGEMRLTLVRVDQIVSIVPLGMDKAKLLELKTAGGSDAPGGLLGVFSEAKESAKEAVALSNLKQIALGFMLYAGDHDDAFPYVQSTASAFRQVQPYLKNEEILKTPNPSGGRILFNMAMAGVASTSVESAAETVLLYEDTPWPDGKRTVAFVDGSAKRLDEAEWQAVAGTLKLRLKRVGKPIRDGGSASRA
ncbi:MAG: hypothetical protein KIS66_08725 [Fimbriimonadaceae bacterium]|nr:hypothetical protein [Fimbriimonadaceae bacterium]